MTPAAHLPQVPLGHHPHRKAQRYPDHSADAEKTKRQGAGGETDIAQRTQHRTAMRQRIAPKPATQSAAGLKIAFLLKLLAAMRTKVQPPGHAAATTRTKRSVRRFLDWFEPGPGGQRRRRVVPPGWFPGRR